jgi:hypothetical protein
LLITDRTIIIKTPALVPDPSGWLYQASSPCIDQGALVNLMDDFIGKQRPNNGFYDIGHAEYYP